MRFACLRVGLCGWPTLEPRDSGLRRTTLGLGDTFLYATQRVSRSVVRGRIGNTGSVTAFTDIGCPRGYRCGAYLRREMGRGNKARALSYCASDARPGEVEGGASVFRLLGDDLPHPPVEEQQHLVGSIARSLAHRFWRRAMSLGTPAVQRSGTSPGGRSRCHLGRPFLRM